MRLRGTDAIPFRVAFNGQLLPHETAKDQSQELDGAASMGKRYLMRLLVATSVRQPGRVSVSWINPGIDLQQPRFPPRSALISLDWARKTPIQENPDRVANRTEFFNTKDMKKTKTTLIGGLIECEFPRFSGSPGSRVCRPRRLLALKCQRTNRHLEYPTYEWDFKDALGEWQASRNSGAEIAWLRAGPSMYCPPRAPVPCCAPPPRPPPSRAG
jgi:hypothetical protein